MCAAIAGHDVFSPLGRATAAQELADRLLAAVAVGVYLPGERFPSERDLATSFAVSRATVREALRVLRDADVVQVRLGRSGGAYVRPLPPGATDGAVRRALGGRGPELAEVFDLRELVESLVARTAAERRSAHDIDRMQQALAIFRAADSQRAQHGSDQALHEAILGAAHNAQLSDLSHRVLAAASLGLPAEPYAADMYVRARREHTALVRAVIDGDVERAGSLARRHFRISADTVGRALATAGSDATTRAP